MVFKKGWNKKNGEKKPVEVVVEKKETNVAQIKPIVPEVKLSKAFYIEKTAGIWKLVIADVQGDKLINKVSKDSMNKAHALEDFKIKFAHTYYFGK